MEAEFDVIKETILLSQIKMLGLKNLKKNAINHADYAEASTIRSEEKIIEKQLQRQVLDLQHLNESIDYSAENYDLHREINLFLTQFERNIPAFEANYNNVLVGLKKRLKLAMFDNNFPLVKELKVEIQGLSKTFENK